MPSNLKWTRPSIDISGEAGPSTTPKATTGSTSRHQVPSRRLPDSVSEEKTDISEEDFVSVTGESDEYDSKFVERPKSRSYSGQQAPITKPARATKGQQQPGASSGFERNGKQRDTQRDPMGDEYGDYDANYGNNMPYGQHGMEREPFLPPLGRQTQNAGYTRPSYFDDGLRPNNVGNQLLPYMYPRFGPAMEPLYGYGGQTHQSGHHAGYDAPYTGPSNPFYPSARENYPPPPQPPPPPPPFWQDPASHAQSRAQWPNNQPQPGQPAYGVTSAGWPPPNQQPVPPPRPAQQPGPEFTTPVPQPAPPGTTTDPDRLKLEEELARLKGMLRRQEASVKEERSEGREADMLRKVRAEEEARKDLEVRIRRNAEQEWHIRDEARKKALEEAKREFEQAKIQAEQIAREKLRAEAEASREKSRQQVEMITQLKLEAREAVFAEITEKEEKMKRDAEQHVELVSRIEKDVRVRVAAEEEERRRLEEERRVRAETQAARDQLQLERFKVDARVQMQAEYDDELEKMRRIAQRARFRALKMLHQDEGLVEDTEMRSHRTANGTRGNHLEDDQESSETTSLSHATRQTVRSQSSSSNDTESPPPRRRPRPSKQQRRSSRGRSIASSSAYTNDPNDEMEDMLENIAERMSRKLREKLGQYPGAAGSPPYRPRAPTPGDRYAPRGPPVYYEDGSWSAPQAWWPADEETSEGKGTESEADRAHVPRAPTPPRQDPPVNSPPRQHGPIPTSSPPTTARVVSESFYAGREVGGVPEKKMIQPSDPAADEFVLSLKRAALAQQLPNGHGNARFEPPEKAFASTLREVGEAVVEEAATSVNSDEELDMFEKGDEDEEAVFVLHSSERVSNCDGSSGIARDTPATWKPVSVESDTLSDDDANEAGKEEQADGIDKGGREERVDDTSPHDESPADLSRRKAAVLSDSDDEPGTVNGVGGVASREASDRAASPATEILECTDSDESMDEGTDDTPATSGRGSYCPVQ